MNTVTIQVQYVNQPKEAHWKQGSIKDTNGQLFNIAKECLGYFQQGETCDVIWEQTGKYPTIVGKGGQMFPSQPVQPQPGTAAQAWAAPLAPKPDLTYEKPPTDMPPILSNVLAHAISAGVLTNPEQLAEWAKWTNEAIKSFHAGVQQRSPGSAARNPDPYSTDDNMEMPMGDPNDPGFQ